MTKEDRLEELYQQGSTISYVKTPSIRFPVGYYELWPEQNKMFWCEIGGGATGEQHVLAFDSWDAEPNQVIFYLEGDIEAVLAPYHEWPEDEEDLASYIQTWKRWQTDPEKELRLENCRRIGAGWRRGENI